jgi:hypothetical protein
MSNVVPTRGVSVSPIPATGYDDVNPTAGDEEAVRALIAVGECSTSHGPGSVKGVALLLLAVAALLSASPRKDEPIEDAFGGMVQNLACAGVF